MHDVIVHLIKGLAHALSFAHPAGKQSHASQALLTALADYLHAHS